jgi:hypothetical protein
MRSAEQPQAALAGCPFLCHLSFGQAKERWVPRRTRRFQMECALRRASKYNIAKRFNVAETHKTRSSKRISPEFLQNRRLVAQSGLFSDADHGMIRDQFRAFIWTHCRGARFSIHCGDMT